MTHAQRINQIKWLTAWGKWCRKQYLTVEPDRKPLYKQVMTDTLDMIKSYETYSGEEKEYEILELL